MRASLTIAWLCVLAAPASAGHPIRGARTTVDLAGYAGAGLAPEPGAGQLDSDAWRVEGLSEGATTFGGTHVTGDPARGADDGGVSNGGLYAFTVAAGDPAFGWQATTDDLSPGVVELRFLNETGASLVDPTIGYELWVHNDSDRSSRVDVGWSLDGATFTPLGALSVTTGATRDATPAWVATPREAVLAGVTIAPEGTLYLRWDTDDVAGSGGRDELALDDVRVEAPGCGDEVEQAGEACDDGGNDDGDGCDATCAIEPGWSCAGFPSACTLLCGNGAIDDGEACDDGGAAGGDGCDAACAVEPGWMCAGEPAVCIEDADGDGKADADDNCPGVPNPSQADADGDGAGNACDELPEEPGGGGGCDAGGGAAGIAAILALLALAARGRSAAPCPRPRRSGR